MRAVADIIESILGSIRLLFLLIFGAIILFGLLMTVGAAVIAPTAVDAAAQSVERLGDKQYDAYRQAEREQALGQEGWGYDEPYAGSGGEVSEEGEYVGGWGDE